MDMRPWVVQSRAGRSLAIAIGCVALGLVLILAVRGGGSRDATAARLLGALLVAIGAAATLTGGTQTVTVDPQTRSITVTDARLLGGTRTVTIAAADIREIAIGYLGRTSNRVQTYFLILKLRSGRDRSLFDPGRAYPGCSDRSTVEGWRRRLAESLALPA